jgi:hypothetical protein
MNVRRTAVVTVAALAIAGTSGGIARATAPRQIPLPSWAKVYAVPPQVARELHVKHGFMLVMPRESVVFAWDGRYWDS